MITEDTVTEIFCVADDFCKVFDAQSRVTGKENRFFLFRFCLICCNFG